MSSTKSPSKPLPQSHLSAPAASEPLELRVTDAIALVQQAMARIAIAAPPLSAAQIKTATKFRKGGEGQIPSLVGLSAQYGVEVPLRPTADMETNLAQALALAPLVTLVARFLVILESATFQVRSETWATATTLYQMLRKAAIRTPALKAELAQLEEFFGYRHPLVKEIEPASDAKLAKEAKRQENAAKKLKRLQTAVADAGAGKAQ